MTAIITPRTCPTGDTPKNHDRKLCACRSLGLDHGDYLGMRDFADCDVQDCGSDDDVQLVQSQPVCGTGDTAKNHHRGLCACSVAVLPLDRDELDDCRGADEQAFGDTTDGLSGGYLDEGDADPEEFFRGSFGHQFGSGEVDEGDADPEDYFRGN